MRVVGYAGAREGNVWSRVGRWGEEEWQGAGWGGVVRGWDEVDLDVGHAQVCLALSEACG